MTSARIRWLSLLSNWMIQHGTHLPFCHEMHYFLCKASLKQSLGHRMPTKQCDGTFGLHIIWHEKVSAGTAVLTSTRTPSFSSLSTKCSVLEFVVISWTNEPLVCCFSVARSAYLDCWNRAMSRCIDWSLLGDRDVDLLWQLNNDQNVIVQSLWRRNANKVKECTQHKRLITCQDNIFVSRFCMVW